ncbi:MAG: DNA adenine methylase [Bacteroidota bacterium]|nr:DNA adenine methylase [Bacteroidota bacterium]
MKLYTIKLSVKEQLELYRVEKNFEKISCKPFLKWPGGKRQLLPELMKRLPKEYNMFFEPFVGGGALLFRVKPDYGYISDINPDLINLYEVVQDNVEELIENLKIHRNTEKYFYELRNADRTEEYKYWNKVEKASRFIYLNKTCFNGLYRMNSDGHFNVPFGFYKNPTIVDTDNLIACSALLKKTDIALASFEAVEKKARKCDFVYFDPPYVPLNKTSSFTKYYKDDFDLDAQFALRELCDRLTKRGVYFMLSNSYTETVKELYKSYDIKTVKANRAINCKANGRGKINELIVTNY